MKDNDYDLGYRCAFRELEAWLRARAKDEKLTLACIWLVNDLFTRAIAGTLRRTSSGTFTAGYIDFAYRIVVSVRMDIINAELQGDKPLGASFRQVHSMLARAEFVPWWRVLRRWLLRKRLASTLWRKK